MKNNHKYYQTATAIAVALTLTSCARFDERMQANGSYDYQEAKLATPYETGDFSNHEARNTYAIPKLTEQQKSVGLTGENVDIRPPTQLMPIIDGVLIDKTQGDSIKVWFNAFNQNDNMQRKVMFLIKSYFEDNNVEIITSDESVIETGVFVDEIVFGALLSKNTLREETSYKLTLAQGADKSRLSVTVDALSYKEENEGTPLKINLVGDTKQDIEMRLVNDLLKYAYYITEAEKRASADQQSLSIKLGFDDNHQNAWIVDNSFQETWQKIPDLFTLLNFSIVDFDNNLGYYLVNYAQPDDDYWAENNLQPFELDSGEYFVQLGEIDDRTTSIVWLDKDKEPLINQQVSDIYISITDYLREALIESEKQTKGF